MTVERCLAARVFSIDVTAFHRRRAQPPDVLGEQVVVDDAAVFGSVDPDDVVVVQVLEPGPVPRFAVLPVAGALGLDHVRRHPQRDLPVDRPAAAGDLRVAVLDGDVVAEEPRRLAAGVGDQGLGLRSVPVRGSPGGTVASLALISSASAFGPMNPRM